MKLGVTLTATLVAVLLAAQVDWTAAQTRDVTNQEIRDAILSLVHSYSLLDNKLERHEQRERALGELIKKGLLTLQKNQRMFEPIKTTFLRLEERVGQIETMLLTQEDRFNLHQEKLTEALEAILQWMTNSKVDQVESGDTNFVGSDSTGSLSKKIEELSDNIKGLRIQIGELRAEREYEEKTNKDLVNRAQELVQSKLASADEVISRLEDKLSHFYITGGTSNGNSNSASVTTRLGGDWETTVVDSLVEIKDNLRALKSESLPDRDFVQGLANQTIERIEDMRLEVLTASDKSFAKTGNRIKEASETIENSVGEVLKTVSDATMTSEAFYTEAQKDLTAMKEDISGLSKLEKVVLGMGDNLLDVKRRIEYGIHQILLEVNDLVNEGTKTLNASVAKRFDDIDSTMMANISSKIETEISQVWRQIGIMYQEISSSKQALDQLQSLTETYVNGTLTTMDGMEGNLNYLLGRLSLVTQEFNQIKLGLGDALDNIRSSFHVVQEKVKDVGPGPHRITSQEAQEAQEKPKITRRHVRRF